MSPALNKRAELDCEPLSKPHLLRRLEYLNNRSLLISKIVHFFFSFFFLGGGVGVSEGLAQ